MAFLSKIGNLIRQTAVIKPISSELSPVLRPSAAIFQAIRCFSSAVSSKLFIGGLSYGTDDQSLREAFSRYGEVIEARVIMDRETGRSRGFGFVTFTSSEEASSAMQELDGQDLHGRRVRVNFANERARPTSNFGYGAPGGYAGGYGAGQRGYGAGQGGYGSGPAGYGAGQGGYGSNPAAYGAGQGGYGSNPPAYGAGQGGNSSNPPAYGAGEGGYSSGQVGYNAGQGGYAPGQPGYGAGQGGYVSGQAGYGSGGGSYGGDVSNSGAGANSDGGSISGGGNTGSFGSEGDTGVGQGTNANYATYGEGNMGGYDTAGTNLGSLSGGSKASDANVISDAGASSNISAMTNEESTEVLYDDNDQFASDVNSSKEDDIGGFDQNNDLEEDDGNDDNGEDYAKRA